MHCVKHRLYDLNMALCSLYLNVHDKEVNLRHLHVSLFQLSSKMLQIVTVQNVNLHEWVW